MRGTTYLFKENNALYEKKASDTRMLQALNQTTTHKLRHYIKVCRQQPSTHHLHKVSEESGNSLFLQRSPSWSRILSLNSQHRHRQRGLSHSFYRWDGGVCVWGVSGGGSSGQRQLRGESPCRVRLRPLLFLPHRCLIICRTPGTKVRKGMRLRVDDEEKRRRVRYQQRGSKRNRRNVKTWKLLGDPPQIREGEKIKKPTGNTTGTAQI